MTKHICDVCCKECKKFHDHLYFEGVDYDLCLDCSRDYDEALREAQREVRVKFLKNKKEKGE